MKREDKIDGLIRDYLTLITKAKLSREEVVIVIAQILIRTGYSFYQKYEDGKVELPSRIEKEFADKLYFEDPTTGTTLMKIGFDLQEELLIKS